jgi:hypothetical protein
MAWVAGAGGSGGGGSVAGGRGWIVEGGGEVVGGEGRLVGGGVGEVTEASAVVGRVHEIVGGGAMVGGGGWVMRGGGGVVGKASLLLGELGLASSKRVVWISMVVMFNASKLPLDDELSEPCRGIAAVSESSQPSITGAMLVSVSMIITSSPVLLFLLGLNEGFAIVCLSDTLAAVATGAASVCA